MSVKQLQLNFKEILDTLNQPSFRRLLSLTVSKVKIDVKVLQNVLQMANFSNK